MVLNPAGYTSVRAIKDFKKQGGGEKEQQDEKCKDLINTKLFISPLEQVTEVLRREGPSQAWSPAHAVQLALKVNVQAHNGPHGFCLVLVQQMECKTTFEDNLSQGCEVETHTFWPGGFRNLN